MRDYKYAEEDYRESKELAIENAELDRRHYEI